MKRNIALCYLRLSNRGKNEVSIPMQRERCRLECERLGLVPVFFEEGLGKHSANTRKRLPEWDKLLQRALTDPTIFCVMSYDHERSFRNVQAARATGEKLSAVGVKLIFTTSGEVDTTTANGKMIFTMQAAFAEHYSNYVSEKLLDHFEELRAKGVYVGHRSPLGLQRMGKAPDVSFAPTDEFAIIEAWLQLYTSRDIGTIEGSKELARKGYRRRNLQGKPRLLGPKDLRDILTRLDLYKPHLPLALYRAAKRRMQERAQHKANGRQRIYPPPLLHRLLFCARCGSAYQSTNQASVSGTMHTYYRHRPPVLCGNIVKPTAEHIAKRVREKVNEIEWSDELKRDIVAQLTAPKDTGVVLDNRLLKEKLERRLENLPLMLADGDIDRAAFLKLKSDTLAELKTLAPPPAVENEPLPEADAWGLVNDLALALTDPELGTPYAKNRALAVVFERVTIEGKKGAYVLDFKPSPLFAKVLDRTV